MRGKGFPDFEAALVRAGIEMRRKKQRVAGSDRTAA
jgi:hypothetical protein